MRTIRNQDGYELEGLRDDIRPEHLPLLVSTWQPSLPWSIKDGYAICNLNGNFDLFTRLLTVGGVDPKKVDVALQEYLSAQQGAE